MRVTIIASIVITAFAGKFLYDCLKVIRPKAPEFISEASTILSTEEACSTCNGAGNLICSCGIGLAANTTPNHYSMRKLGRSFRVREVVATARMKFRFTAYTQINEKIVHKYVNEKLAELHVRAQDRERITMMIVALVFIPGDADVEHARLLRSDYTATKLIELRRARGEVTMWDEVKYWCGYTPVLSHQSH